MILLPLILIAIPLALIWDWFRRRRNIREEYRLKREAYDRLLEQCRKDLIKPHTEASE